MLKIKTNFLILLKELKFILNKFYSVKLFAALKILAKEICKCLSTFLQYKQLCCNISVNL